MFPSSFQEEKIVTTDSKLQAVFSKLSGVLPRAEDLGNSNAKIMANDIIESVLAESHPLPVQTNWSHNYATLTSPEDPDHAYSIHALSGRLETALRSAKRSHLSCGEVLIPAGLLRRIAKDIISMAESEPCGVRGCKLILLFETTEHCVRLATVEGDVTTPATFELYLTLKQSGKGWQFLPQFLRNLTRGGTIVVSPAYTISKKKLYRSYKEE